MSNSKPLFVYWDIRAYGEAIRLLLHYLEIDFEDRRIPFGEIGVGIPELLEPWMSQKFTHGLEFPNLPFYVDSDVKITQSTAILQHLGRKHNLYGSTLQDQATIDMITHTVDDLRKSAFVIYNAPNFHDIKDDWKETIPGRLSEMNKFLEGKRFVLGDQISFVDFHLHECMEWFRLFAPDLFKENPGLKNLEEFRKRIQNLPQIKKYMETGAFKELPLFGPAVFFGFTRDPDFKPMMFPYRNIVAKYPVDK